MTMERKDLIKLFPSTTEGLTEDTVRYLKRRGFLKQDFKPTDSYSRAETEKRVKKHNARALASNQQDK